MKELDVGEGFPNHESGGTAAHQQLTTPTSTNTIPPLDKGVNGPVKVLLLGFFGLFFTIALLALDLARVPAAQSTALGGCAVG